MSGRTYCNKEIMQWGYVALVCVALAFTTMSGATASDKPGTIVPEYEGKLGMCTATHRVGEMPEKQACEATSELTSNESASSLLGSSFVNATFNPYTGGSPLLAPSHEKHAD